MQALTTSDAAMSARSASTRRFKPHVWSTSWKRSQPSTLVRGTRATHPPPFPGSCGSTRGDPELGERGQAPTRTRGRIAPASHSEGHRTRPTATVRKFSARRRSASRWSSWRARGSSPSSRFERVRASASDARWRMRPGSVQRRIRRVEAAGVMIAVFMVRTFSRYVGGSRGRWVDGSVLRTTRAECTAGPRSAGKGRRPAVAVATELHGCAGDRRCSEQSQRDHRCEHFAPPLRREPGPGSGS